MDWLMQQELESEWNARFDSVAEAYGATARDADDFARSDDYADAEAAWEEEIAYRMDSDGLTREQAIEDMEAVAAEAARRHAEFDECPF